MKLIIGNQNYSSWSLRPWALLKYFKIDFQQQKIYLFTDKMLAEMSKFCPNNKVPVLINDGIKIWDSLAICEYINEHFLSNKAWPDELKQRAHARAICAEMHSGFFAIRNEMPMNCRRQPSPIPLSEACQKDIERIINLWEAYLKNSQSPFLFDRFSIADAFYLPIISRFISYQIEVPPLSREYMTHMTSLALYKEWINDAKNEKECIDCAEI